MDLSWTRGAWLPALLICTACSDVDPTVTSSSALPPQSGPSGGDDDASNDDGPDDDTSAATSAGDPTTTTADDTGEDTGDDTGDDTGNGEPLPSRATCERYLDCIAVTQPESLPEAQQGFGPDGTCWDGPPASQEQCVMACQVALAQQHDYYPEVMACWLCQSNMDCGAEATCEAGNCVPIPGPGCGDGIVQPDETCDQPYCFDDCQFATCNPLSNAGCSGTDECRFAWYQYQTGVQCLEPAADLPKDGQGCQYDPGVAIDYCAFGLVCSPANLIEGCPGTGCCTRLCDLQGPDDCPDGRLCEPLPDEVALYGSYVGLCVPT